MRSLYLRILFASFGTVLASLVAFLATFFAMSAPANERLFRHFQAVQIEEVTEAFERGGAESASAYLGRWNRSLDATHYLTDAAGRDLVSGEDRAALLRVPRGVFGAPPQIDGRMLIVGASADSRFRLIILVPPPFNISTFLPYYALILGALALLCWLLAVGIASPLRQLAGAVNRFGRGDLMTRVPAGRRDEIGNLAQSFNEMAERIQTLLTAERRLLQDISHELRSPLTRLSLGIELARTASDREAALARLQKEVDRLTKLVGSLLEVTRVEGDPSSRKSEAVLLRDIVEDVVQSCTLEAQARGCRIAVDDHATRVLYGDPELLRRAVENVLRNAIRYAPDDSDIELRAEDCESTTVISVRDAGRGVPEELLPRLSQPFFRVEDARDQATGGVGLGLAIARRAVQLHHGTLHAENAHPGLRVTLTIPYESTTTPA